MDDKTYDMAREIAGERAMIRAELRAWEEELTSLDKFGCQFGVGSRSLVSQELFEGFRRAVLEVLEVTPPFHLHKYLWC